MSAPSYVPRHTVSQATPVVEQHFLGSSQHPQQDRTHGDGIMAFRGLAIADGNYKMINKFEGGSVNESTPSTSKRSNGTSDRETVPEIRIKVGGRF